MWFMSWSEVAGFVAGALSVFLYVRQSVWAWPTGIANSAFWLILFWDTGLFLDAGLQVVYIGLGVAGWIWWARGQREDGVRRSELPVARTSRPHALALVAIGLVATVMLWWAMEQVNDAAPLPDAATTVVSLIANTCSFESCWGRGGAGSPWTSRTSCSTAANSSTSPRHCSRCSSPCACSVCAAGRRPRRNRRSWPRPRRRSRDDPSNVDARSRDRQVPAAAPRPLVPYRDRVRQC